MATLTIPQTIASKVHTLTVLVCESVLQVLEARR